MSENVILGLFGFLITAIMACVGKLFSDHKELANRVATEHNNLAHKVTRIETALMMINENALKILHNDDDRYRMDDLINKYLDRHYDLSHTEWEELEHLLEKVMNNKENPDGARLAASMAYHLCRHKRFLEPDKTKGYSMKGIKQ